MPHHHHHVTTNAPTQLDDIIDNNTRFDTRFDENITKLENIIQRAVKVHLTTLWVIIDYLRTTGNYFVLLPWRLFY